MFLMVLMIWHIRTKYIRTVIDQTWVGVYVYVWGGGEPLFVSKSPKDFAYKNQIANNSHWLDMGGYPSMFLKRIRLGI